METRIARLEAKAERAASEAEAIDKRRERIEASKRGDVWKRRTLRPLGFAASVLLRKVLAFTERADRLARAA